MPFHQPDSIRYYTFDSLTEAGVTHAVFTRRGGVSPQPWHSLNVGGLRGDDPAHVLENRVRSFKTLGRDPDSVYDVWQVHSNDVISTDGPRRAPHIQADAIFTDRPEVTLFMRFGDCVPILLADPRRGAVGLVHAGWIGTVNKVVQAALEALQARYGSRTEDVVAAIGPSIAAHHYPVGEEVAAQARRAFGEHAGELLSPNEDGRITFDLWAANRLLLEQHGVGRIEIAGLCTACHLEDWYSHRGEHGNTGRFGALIVVGPNPPTPLPGTGRGKRSAHLSLSLPAPGREEAGG